MSNRYKGGFITATPPTTSSSSQSAPGIWTTTQQMQIVAAGNWPPFIPTDPYFDYVTMLLTGNGTNGAQNNTFLDSSSNAFSITRNGNTTQGSFSPYGSLWSNYFNGSTDYLSTSSISLGATFTIGAWVCLTGDLTVRNPIINVGDSDSGGSGCLLLYRSNEIQFRLNGTTTGTGASVSSGVWNYISVTRSSGTITIYLNGTSIGTISNSSTFSGTVKIGGAAVSATDYFTTGYLSNVYINTTTASSSVPTSPSTAVSGTQLLTCQSNRFIDNSANAYTITPAGTPSVQRFSPFNPTASYDTATIGGSGYFTTASGDYLTMPSNTAFNFGSGNFTFEAWIYPTNLSDGMTIFADVQYWYAFLFRVQTNGSIYSTSYPAGGSSPNWDFSSSGAQVIFPNTWSHVALVRNSSTLTIYVNGVSVATGSFGGSVSNASSPRIGHNDSYADANGYISNVRIVKGTAVYTTAFTPPTAPLTAISGTSLLTSMTNAGIPDSAMMNDLETVGNAQVSTSVKKFGTGSIAFDGNGDYLKSNANTSLYTFGTGDFTVEFWMYSNSFASTATLYDGRPDGNDGSSQPFVCIFQDTSGQVGLFVLNTTQITSSALSTSTWYHVAVCRSGTSTKMFINGTQVGSTYTDSNNYLCGTNRPSIGANGYSSGNFSYNGYIDDLRITKGYARYTANFTPPTEAFPTF